jgi:hypothetical protein
VYETCWRYKQSYKSTHQVSDITFSNFTDIFYSRGSGASLLWNAIKQAWSALFAPYHLMQTV